MGHLVHSIHTAAIVGLRSHPRTVLFCSISAQGKLTNSHHHTLSWPLQYINSIFQSLVRTRHQLETEPVAAEPGKRNQTEGGDSQAGVCLQEQEHT